MGPVTATASEKCTQCCKSTKEEMSLQVLSLMPFALEQALLRCLMLIRSASFSSFVGGDSESQLS